MSHDYSQDATTVGCWLMDGGGSTVRDISALGTTLTEGAYSDGAGYYQGGWQGYTRATNIVPAGFSGLSRSFRGSVLYSGDVSATALNIHGSVPITISACVCTTAALSGSSGYMIAGKYLIGGNQRQYALMVVNNGGTGYQARFVISPDGGSANSKSVTTTTVFPINTTDTSQNIMHRFTGVYDGAHLSIYTDGVLDCTPLAFTGSIFNGSAVFTIGDYYPQGTLFKGYIDEVLVSNIAMTPTQIADMGTNGVDGTKGANDTRTAFTNYWPTAISRPSLTYADVLSKVAALAAANPSWISESIGTSGNGLDMRMITISHGAADTQTIFVDAGIHGYEKLPVLGMLAFLNYAATNPAALATTKIAIVPVVNPDGFVLNSRKNNNTATGESVDLNRNFSYGWTFAQSDPANINYQGASPATQPETQALMYAMRKIRPNKYLNYHTPLNQIIRATSVPNTVPYAINAFINAQGFDSWIIGTSAAAGPARDWARFENGCEAFTNETRDIDESDYANIEECNKVIATILGFIAATSSASWSPPSPEIPMVM